MRINRMKRTVCLSAAACLLVGGLAVGRAMAYFTAYAETSGGVVMDMGFTTIIPDEEVREVEGGWIKEITVRNTGDYPCYVRVKLLYAQLEGVTVTAGGTNWTAGEDDYYYYTPILQAKDNANAERLDARITRPADSLQEDGMNFNVIVVAECTPVLYDEDGNPSADLSWSKGGIIIQESQSTLPGEPQEPQPESSAADKEGE